jgi:hypothetical protein
MSRLIGLFLILCFPVIVFSQTEEATTESGKKVILFPDGTWKLKTAEIKKPTATVSDKKEEKNKSIPYTSTIGGDCGQVIESVKDKNNTVIVRTKSFLIVTRPEDRSEVDISMQKGAKGVIAVSFRTGTGSECIGEGNRLFLFFEDGSKLELTNEGPANCRGESISYFSGPYGKKKQLQELRDKKIRSVRIQTQQNSISQEFSNENQEEFIRLLNCITAS